MVAVLNNIKREIDLNKVSLQDIALFFEQFEGCLCKIITMEETICFDFELNALPHLLGIGHIMMNNKNKKSFIGKQGFLKLKNGDVTYNILKKYIKDEKCDISWKDIKERISYFVMFLNTISKSKLCIRDNELLLRRTKLKGNYFLYRNCKNNKYPLFSIKRVSLRKCVLETFIVENRLSLIGALKEQKVLSISIEKKKELVNV